jgi:hypothetical protein
MLFRTLMMIVLLSAAQKGSAQKLARFEFNLYTDSLKRGFYNYINVEGQFSDSSWQPLDSSRIRFTCSAGAFRGNDIFLDSSYTADTLLVRATLKEDPKRWKECVIYIRKRGFAPLPSEQELLNGTPADKPKRGH